MADFQDTHLGGSASERKNGDRTHPDRHSKHGEAITGPAVPPTWKDWQERQLAAFAFAIGVTNGQNELDVERLEAARSIAKRALAVASSIKFPYPPRSVEEIGALVLGEAPDRAGVKMIIGSQVIDLLAAEHSIEAPRFAQWLTIWATTSADGSFPGTRAPCIEWPDRFRRGLDLVAEGQKN